jgi:hypothetical protein
MSLIKLSLAGIIYYSRQGRVWLVTPDCGRENREPFFTVQSANGLLFNCTIFPHLTKTSFLLHTCYQLVAALQM